MSKNCFFIGHADIGNEIMPRLEAAVKRQIEENNVTEFYVGGHGHFDAIVVRILKEAKKVYPQICCYYVAAYHPGLRRVEVPEGMDGIVYPLHKSVPPRFALPRANRAMVNQSNVLIAAVKHPGNSRELLEYALKREQKGLIQVENLMEMNTRCSMDDTHTMAMH